MRHIHRLRNQHLGRKVFSGAGLIVAIVTIATAISDVEAFKTAGDWVLHHAALGFAVMAAFILVDDLRRAFARQGSSVEHERHRTADEQRVKYLAFISASCGEESFYSMIFNHLVQRAREMSDSGTRLLVIPWFPRQSFDIGTELRDDVRSLQTVNNFRFSGLFVIPDDPDTDLADLRLLREVSNNIVFLDINFDPNNRPLDWDPCFVGGNEVRGAGMAADIAIDYLHAVGLEDDPRLLVVRGRSTMWESQRYLSFRDAVVKAIPSAIVKFSDIEAMYSREKARDYVYKQMRADVAHTSLPHVIFACNDDMAIGAHDAIYRLIGESILDLTAAPRIVGYDGTSEMKYLLDVGDELMIGTVDVSITQMAHYAMENMKRLIQGSSPVQRDPKMQPIRAIHPPQQSGGLPK